MTSRWLIFTFAALAVTCGGSRPTDRPATDAAVAPPPAPAAPGTLQLDEGMLRDLRLTTATIESRRGDDQVVLLGELAVDERRYAEVGSPIGARVIRLLAAPGDSVRAEQALVELQSAEVGRARADYLAAVSRRTLAAATFDRKTALAAERIAPQREVQEAEAEVAAAEAQVRNARAALGAFGVPVPDAGAGADAASASFLLRAPLAGTVIDRHATRGQMIEPATSLFRIADLSTLWLTVHAFERDAVRIRPKSRARVTFAALPAQEFSGIVTLIGREVSTQSRTIDVRIDINNPTGVLRPGMSAEARVPIDDGGAPIVAVPVGAVQRVGERWCVFVPQGAGVFEIRTIGRGRDLGTDVEVLSGLSAGDVVVVDGAFLLKSQAEKRDAGHEGE
jgi:cobalt-zinc-cadmium efflux system membrane fusion protein